MITLQSACFDPWQELSAFQQQRPELDGKFGATSIFVGTMRDFNEEQDVTQMVLEHYPGMTEKHLETICNEAKQQWDINELLLIHRYGEILPNQPIVLIAAWSAHRADAFAASRYLIEELKTRAPFWKNETVNDGTRWVQANTPA